MISEHILRRCDPPLYEVPDDRKYRGSAYCNFARQFGHHYADLVFAPLPLGWRRPHIRKEDGYWTCTVAVTELQTRTQAKIEGRGDSPILAWAAMRWQLGKGFLP